MKKKPIIKLIIFLSLLILVLHFGCNKPSQPQAITQIPIPQSIKDFIAFKPGSYWVYRDSSTAQLDSQYVISYEDGKGNPAYEFLHIRMGSSLNSTYIDIYSYALVRQDYCHCMEDVIYGGLSSTSVLMIFPTTDFNTKDSMLPDIVQNVPSNPTSIISGNTFTNVLKTYHTNNPVEGNQPENDYFSPHIGLFRKELLGTHHLWNLIRYHVIQ